MNNNCNLGILSIILILCIIILVFYKNMKDNSTEHFENPQDIRNKFETKIISLINTNTTPTTTTTPTPTTTTTPTITTTTTPTHTLVKTNKDNRLTTLENSVTDLENSINNKKLLDSHNTTYYGVKSINNGMEMNLIENPDSINSYLVNVNNGCISVGANDYDVYKCNNKIQKQHFKMQHIFNQIDYENNIDKAIPFDNVDKDNIDYPFAMIKSVNNDNCLTNNQGILTIQPCSSFVAQRWMPLYK